MDSFSVGLPWQGSDHHEGPAERGADGSQPAEEEGRRAFHALPPDSAQNHRGKSHRVRTISIVLYCIHDIASLYQCGPVVSSPQTKTLMGEVMREAAFSLAEAKFAAGDFR